jgi:hypothetical protein
MAEYHGRPGWIAVFLKRNYATIMKLNSIFHLSYASIASLFFVVVLQGLNL